MTCIWKHLRGWLETGSSLEAPMEVCGESCINIGKQAAAISAYNLCSVISSSPELHLEKSWAIKLGTIISVCSFALCSVFTMCVSSKVQVSIIT